MKRHEIIEQVLVRLGAHGHSHKGAYGCPGKGLAMTHQEYQEISSKQAAEASPVEFAAVRSYTEHPDINAVLRNQRKPATGAGAAVVDDAAYWQWQADNGGQFLPTHHGYRHPEDPNMPLTIDAEYAGHYWKDRNQPIHPIQIKMTEQDIIKGIDSSMRPLDRDLTLYRGSLGSENWKLRGGETFKDDGFLSTTIDASKADRFGVDFFELHVPKGTPAVFADAFSKVFPDDTGKLENPFYTGTGEVLLGRGLNFRYTGTNEVAGKTFRVFEVHPAGSLGATKSIAPRISKAKYS